MYAKTRKLLLKAQLKPSNSVTFQQYFKALVSLSCVGIEQIEKAKDEDCKFNSTLKFAFWFGNRLKALEWWYLEGVCRASLMQFDIPAGFFTVVLKADKFCNPSNAERDEKRHNCNDLLCDTRLSLKGRFKLIMIKYSRLKPWWNLWL